MYRYVVFIKNICWLCIYSPTYYSLITCADNKLRYIIMLVEKSACSPYDTVIRAIFFSADAGRVWRSLPSGVLYFRVRDLRCGRPDLETNTAGGGDVFSLMKSCPFRLYKSSVIDQKLGPVYTEKNAVLSLYSTGPEYGVFSSLFFFIVTTIRWLGDFTSTA